MSNIFIVASAVLFVVLLFRLYFLFQDKIKFFMSGFDKGFKVGEISVLWKLSKSCKLENPSDIYSSTSTLNKCISSLIEKSKSEQKYSSSKFQCFLEKLYKFRTKIALDHENKKGLENTQFLDEWQRLRIILKGSGVFHSKIINNGRELVVSMPRQYNKKSKRYVTLPPENWQGQTISVYLWRKDDACYAFDTVVLKAGFFRGYEVLFLRHSFDLVRIQKRQSIRSACQIYADLYVIKDKDIDYSVIEISPGYRCLIEDISGDGAMIRIGGKGEKDIMLKLQFKIDDTQIVMFGAVRAVEYNSALNQSRLHLECTHIDPVMQNKILSFVYNILPQEQKDFHEAIAGIDSDEENSVSDENNAKPEENEIPSFEDDEKTAVFADDESKMEVIDL